ncbi:MAG: hypothetical protein LBD59_00490 [Prevotellaceae bacterium]|jgi:hypothetical protein|nr:hypothetical protein [Prevotellaceae bacterium]
MKAKEIKTKHIINNSAKILEYSDCATERLANTLEYSDCAAERLAMISECSDYANERLAKVSECSDYATERLATVSECSDYAAEGSANVSECSDCATEYSVKVSECSDCAAEGSATVSECSDCVNEIFVDDFINEGCLIDELFFNSGDSYYAKYFSTKVKYTNLDNNFLKNIISNSTYISLWIINISELLFYILIFMIFTTGFFLLKYSVSTVLSIFNWLNMVVCRFLLQVDKYKLLYIHNKIAFNN